MKVALIPPVKKDDYLLNTVIDGLFEFAKEDPGLEFFLLSGYPNPFSSHEMRKHELDEGRFVEFAKTADIIILSFIDRYTNFSLAEKIGRWDKTIVIDGGEWGKDRRFDFNVQRSTLYEFLGNADVPDSVLNKCGLYARREKPYIKGVVPFPFGIETRYTRYATENQTKDIDFVCIWGQDEHPLLRRHATELLKSFCAQEGFTCATDKTKGFDYGLERTGGRDEFYRTLARAKVGISIGGGGYDTVRFWEILANNCLLLTERIDIYHPESTGLDYGRIYQFNNLYDFHHQLERVGNFLKTTYRQGALGEEYRRILEMHSSKARVALLFAEAKKRNLLS